MKKVIDGKMYNTETAREIASFDNGLGYNDFRHCSETLYLTKKGAWFLQGEGGPMSKYSRSVGDMTGGGEEFEILTPNEALSWLENHEITDTIEEYFADKIEEA